MESFRTVVVAALRGAWSVTWRLSWLFFLGLFGLCVFWALDDLPAGRALSGGVVKCASEVSPVEAQCVRDEGYPFGYAGPGDRTLTYYQFDVLRTDCTLFFIRETRDALDWTWPTTAYVTIVPKKKGVGPVNFTMSIPMDASAGVATFVNRFGWYCNPWHWVFRGLRENDMPRVAITVLRD